MIVKLRENEAKRDTTFLVTIDVYGSDGVAVVPTSSLLTLDRGGTLLFEDETASISLAGVVTYTIAVTYTDLLFDDMVLTNKYVVAGVTLYSYHFISVVITPLVDDVTTAELIKRYPYLVSDDMYSTQSNYQIQINEAFEEVKSDIKNKGGGRRSDMVIDGGQVRLLVIYKTLAIINESFRNNPEDLYNARFTLYGEKYLAKLETLIINYDTDRSGQPDTERGGGYYINKR